MPAGDIMQMATDAHGVPNEQIVIIRNKPPLRCGVAVFDRRQDMVALVGQI
jgi:hypothetical protein